MFCSCSLGSILLAFLLLACQACAPHPSISGWGGSACLENFPNSFRKSRSNSSYQGKHHPKSSKNGIKTVSRFKYNKQGLWSKDHFQKIWSPYLMVWWCLYDHPVSIIIYQSPGDLLKHIYIIRFEVVVEPSTFTIRQSLHLSRNTSGRACCRRSSKVNPLKGQISSHLNWLLKSKDLH